MIAYVEKMQFSINALLAWVIVLGLSISFPLIVCLCFKLYKIVRVKVYNLRQATDTESNKDADLVPLATLQSLSPTASSNVSSIASNESLDSHTTRGVKKTENGELDETVKPKKDSESQVDDDSAAVNKLDNTIDNQQQTANTITATTSTPLNG